MSLLGTYLLFTLVLVNASIFITIITLNIHWRHPNTHHMPDWVKRWFFDIIPPFLFMAKPRIGSAILRRAENGQGDGEGMKLIQKNDLSRLNQYLKTTCTERYPPVIQQAIRDIRYISEAQREAQRDDLVSSISVCRLGVPYRLFRREKVGDSLLWSSIDSV